MHNMLYNLHLRNTFCSKTDFGTSLDWPLKYTKTLVSQQTATRLFEVKLRQTSAKCIRSYKTVTHRHM